MKHDMKADITAAEFLDHPSEVEKIVADSNCKPDIMDHPSEVLDSDYILLPEDENVVSLKSSKSFCDNCEYNAEMDERLGSSDDSSSSNPSEEDAADQEALNSLNHFEETCMVTGFSASSLIHCLSTLDDGCSSRVTTNCVARPSRLRAEFASARDMKSKNKRFCSTCTSEWPIDVVQHLTK